MGKKAVVKIWERSKKYEVTFKQNWTTGKKQVKVRVDVYIRTNYKGFKKSADWTDYDYGILQTEGGECSINNKKYCHIARKAWIKVRGKFK